MLMYKVKLSGAASVVAPSAGGNLRWKRMQERSMSEDDYRLAYYRRANTFEVNVDREAPKPVAPSQRPNRAPKTEKVATPVVDLGVEEVTPLAESTPELPDGPPTSNIPDDAVLEGWLKDDLIKLAEEYGLFVDKSMTKAYIRAEIDTIR